MPSFDTSDFEITMPFGKHRGTPLADMDPGYLGWMLRTGAADPQGRLGGIVEEFKDLIEETIRTHGQRSAAAFEVDYELNDSQLAAVDAIEAALINGDESLFRLEGGAGYGKSFAVMEVVRRALTAGIQVKACATSYVATQVLAQQLGRISVEAKTIASTIRLAKIEFEDREEYTESEQTGEALEMLLRKGNLLIVDEYSMVSDDIAVRMMEAAQSFGGKLLVVGDLSQLPPVKQAHDSAFARIAGSVTLTQPMRYNTDSDLFALEQLARHNPEGVFNGGWKSSTEVHLHESLESLTVRYVADMMQAPSEDARMLFFRRKDVFEANATIRQGLFGDEAASSPVVEDERLMVMETTDVKVTGEPVRFYSGQSFLVSSVRKATVRDIPCYMVTFSTGLTVPVIFGQGTTVTDSRMRGSEEYTGHLKELRDEAIGTGSWTEWREFKNSFLKVGYNYAMTVHRCQGQTVDRVYFSPAMLRRSGPIADKLLYVAATRAKKAAHIVGGEG